jgi:glycosyltransferase involved in cell wall biosynthesis
MKISLSIVIISGNAEKSILECLKSCSFASEIIIVAANSSDQTKTISKKFNPKIKIIETTDEYNRNFTKWRNLGYNATKYPWILYVDTDEIVSSDLQNEITKILKNSSDKYSYYVVPRENYYLNHRVKYGGSYPDYVKRLYNTKFFKGYQGILHEEPIVTGTMGYLKYPLIHHTHNDLYSMLQKSLAWTDMEAKALFDNSHPPVVWWRFPRMMLTKFWHRLVLEHMWKDGTVGWISVIFEMFDTFMIYARLWELQQSSNPKSHV